MGGGIKMGLGLGLAGRVSKEVGMEKLGLRVMFLEGNGDEFGVCC